MWQIGFETFDTAKGELAQMTFFFSVLPTRPHEIPIVFCGGNHLEIFLLDVVFGGEVVGPDLPRVIEQKGEIAKDSEGKHSIFLQTTTEIRGDILPI